MNDDYLWDKRGTPDPELERLERTLGTLAHEERPLVMPAPGGAHAPRPHFYRPGAGAWLLAAAGLLVIAGGTLWLAKLISFGHTGEARTRVSGPGWNVSSLAGSPRVGSRVIAAAGRLGLGEWLVTDDESRAPRGGEIGEVTLEPNSPAPAARGRRRPSPGAGARHAARADRGAAAALHRGDAGGARGGSRLLVHARSGAGRPLDRDGRVGLGELRRRARRDVHPRRRALGDREGRIARHAVHAERLARVLRGAARPRRARRRGRSRAERPGARHRAR
jgi:hypothetical protein